MSEDIRRLAVQQRKRLVATVLSAAENSEWWSTLSGPEQKAHRDKVLGAINTYHDFILDVITVGDDDPRQAHVVQLLEQVHASQLRLERSG